MVQAMSMYNLVFIIPKSVLTVHITFTHSHTDTLTHPLNVPGVVRQDIGEDSSVVSLIIKPSYLLPQHGLEGEVTDPVGEAFSGHTETQGLGTMEGQEKLE